MAGFSGGFLDSLNTWGDSGKSDSQKYGQLMSSVLGSVGDSFVGSGSSSKGDDLSWAFQQQNPQRKSFSGSGMSQDPMKQLASQRQYPEDSLVAHISPYEAALLKLMGGAGTRNKNTGLLQFGWSGGGDDGEGNDGGFHDDRDSGYDGGDGEGDTSGWGGKFSREGSGYSSGSSFGRESDRFNSDNTEQGPIGQKFQNAFSRHADYMAQSPTYAESLEDRDIAARSQFMGDYAGINDSPFGDWGLAKDTTPTSKAGGMFSQAKAQQIADVVNIGGVLDDAMGLYGYQSPQQTTQPTSPLTVRDEDTYGKYFNTDWSRFNLSNQLSKKNAMSNDEFADYVTKSPVAASLLGNIRDMELGGYDVSGMGITSGNKGTHASGSKHYANNAVDTNTKIGGGLLGELTSRMEKAGWSRGDKLGFGSRESHHFQ